MKKILTKTIEQGPGTITVYTVNGIVVGAITASAVHDGRPWLAFVGTMAFAIMFVLAVVMDSWRMK